MKINDFAVFSMLWSLIAEKEDDDDGAIAINIHTRGRKKRRHSTESWKDNSLKLARSPSTGSVKSSRSFKGLFLLVFF